LPWNPAKVEQRVGRLDRIGQKAEIITIINLVNTCTIEDHIMARLLERVKIFDSSLGPLGDILSKYRKEFRKEVLNSNRSDKEKEEYEKTVLRNINRKAKDQKALGEKQDELFGIMDFFADEKEKRLLFRENEIRIIWNTFLDAYGEKNNISINDQTKGDEYSLVIDENTKRMLHTIMELLPMRKFNKKKKQHYKEVVEKRYFDKSPLQGTFSLENALKNRKAQFFSIAHPFIQGAINYLKETKQTNDKVLTCSISSKSIKKDTYLIFIYRFN